MRIADREEKENEQKTQLAAAESHIGHAELCRGLVARTG